MSDFEKLRSDAQERSELDRYITGNYGEDQFKHEKRRKLPMKKNENVPAKKPRLLIDIALYDRGNV